MGIRQVVLLQLLQQRGNRWICRQKSLVWEWTLALGRANWAVNRQLLVLLVLLVLLLLLLVVVVVRMMRMNRRRRRSRRRSRRRNKWRGRI